MKPILFNTDMVRAILDGRKTVTRRAIKPKFKPEEAGWNIVTNKHTGEFCYCEYYDEYEESTRRLNPPYFPGDILYVRETWTRLYWVDMEGYTHYDKLMYYYAADGEPDIILRDADGFEEEDQRIRWRPSIHMPKQAARLFLRVTDVRAERLQDMRFSDLVAEGFASGPVCEHKKEIAMMEFSKLWNGTVKPSDFDRYGWEANPWVWVIEFEMTSPAGILGKGWFDG